MYSGLLKVKNQALYRNREILLFNNLQTRGNTHTYLLSTSRTDCEGVSDEPLVVRISVTVLLVGEGTATDRTDEAATLRGRDLQ